MSDGKVDRLRRELTDARELCRRLGLDDGARPQAGGLLIRCPWHADQQPSCSVRLGPDGTIAVRCFACGETGDVFSLVAVVNGLSCRTDFTKVLDLASELAGTDSNVVHRPVAQTPLSPSPVRSYPPFGEVAALWDSARPVAGVPTVAKWLESRALRPAVIDELGVARALVPGLRLPTWARFGRHTWWEAGYRLVLPMFDARGDLRSVRVRRIVAGEGPKALPPTGHSTGGLVLAEPFAQRVLKTGKWPGSWSRAVPRIVIVEGEPDFLTQATLRFDDGWRSDDAGAAVMGIVAGSWTSEIAARIPGDGRVIVRTDHDVAGEKYASAVFESMRGRATLLRGGATRCETCSRGASRHGTERAIDDNDLLRMNELSKDPEADACSVDRGAA